ncbi:MAG: alpha-L-fucosidase [Acidobacteriaceae bacterium]|nr:alpha-L-fucosidase [Acidobacteriaceae bacterium]MBV9780796.1 alpha-L-fucosidase [Acidobacteriaceae bacterium]
MNRRQVLKRIAVPVAAAFAQPVDKPKSDAQAIGPATERTPLMAEYERLRFGVSYHFSMNTFTGDDYEQGKVPATTYNPTKLDVRQWISAAHDLGAKYAVLTAKHMSGFALWDSEGYEYDVAASGNKTDVVAAFMAACREFDIRPGFYYCILDPHNEGKFDWNAPVLPAYYKLIYHQVTELHTRYPGAFYQLFDITWKVSDEQRWELYRLVKKLNPECVIVMNQAFYQSKRNQGRTAEPKSWPTDVINGEDQLPPPEGHDPHLKFEGKTYYLPFEAWMPAGPLYPPMPGMHSWFWREGFKTQSPEAIAGFYRACTTRNSNLLLNLSPDKTGRLPDEQVETLHAAAKLIHA